MKKFLNNRQRRRIAFALCAVFIIIVLANWWVSYTMTQVSSQVESVYQDRLVPALDIAAIQERFYQNRVLLEEHLHTDVPALQQQLENSLHENMREVDSLAAKYETTFLTSQETENLQLYKNAVAHLTTVQLQAIELSRAGDKAAADSLFKAAVVPAFNTLLLPMHTLSQLQQVVGHEVCASAEQKLSRLQMLSTLVIVLAVVLALLVGVLLQTNHQNIQINPQQFHLN
ncbi:MCP four helix bundle domain-containing protein [Botryobacter ruber]|uniref:MCP four helix bundle domain-containing protein n=1 Tax=Botryobacter ruber TaxID=2171629 RepID=UPI0013E342EF|nr:MCP four helix bundle domain-containing protein [Botryobacter ruber]